MKYQMYSEVTVNRQDRQENAKKIPPHGVYKHLIKKHVSSSNLTQIVN